MADIAPVFVFVDGTMGPFSLPSLPDVWCRVVQGYEVIKLMAAYLRHIEERQITLHLGSSVHFEFGQETIRSDTNATIDSLGIQGIGDPSSGPTMTCTIRARVGVEESRQLTCKTLLRTRQS